MQIQKDVQNLFCKNLKSKLYNCIETHPTELKKNIPIKHFLVYSQKVSEGCPQNLTVIIPGSKNVEWGVGWEE